MTLLVINMKQMTQDQERTTHIDDWTGLNRDISPISCPHNFQQNATQKLNNKFNNDDQRALEAGTSMLGKRPFLIDCEDKNSDDSSHFSESSEDTNRQKRIKNEDNSNFNGYMTPEFGKIEQISDQYMPQETDKTDDKHQKPYNKNICDWYNHDFDALSSELPEICYQCNQILEDKKKKYKKKRITILNTYPQKRLDLICNKGHAFHINFTRSKRANCQDCTTAQKLDKDNLYENCEEFKKIQNLK